MNIEILTSAAQPIPIHAMLAIFSIVVGAIQFALTKGTFLHRVLGYIWVAMMFVVAASSFFINEFRWVGPFGPIHILSAFVLFSLWRGINHARHHRIAAHKANMVSLYIYSLLLAGAFTFLPGRVMYRVLFG